MMKLHHACTISVKYFTFQVFIVGYLLLSYASNTCLLAGTYLLILSEFLTLLFIGILLIFYRKEQM